MKIIKALLLIGFLSFNVFANTQNDDKENKKVLKTIYENIIINDVSKALKSSLKLEDAIKSKKVKLSKAVFTDFVRYWKSVSTLYILGDLNEDYIDTPRYIDIFHNGNEDITKQLDRVIKSKDDVKISLFKNSLKSINALEYILSTKDITKKRINKIALTIIEKIHSHLVDIKMEYLAQEKNFLSDMKKANSIFINTIVQSTYKLKEWRIGDILGATKKYQNKADNKRAEYYLSKNSKNAIIAILNTYIRVFDNPKTDDYGDFLLKITDGNDIKDLRKYLNQSLKYAKQIKNDDFKDSKKLYKSVSKVHVTLFLEIIEDLSISAKILEADGD